MPRLVCLLSLLSVSPVFALTQPNGAQIPSQMGCDGGKPTGLAATFACVCTTPGICNIGAVCPSMSSCPNGQNGTCETTLWHAFNDNTCIPSNKSGLDPWTQASTTPETFHPTCAQTFTVVGRPGAKFQNAFGWYNVTAQKPAPADLHLMLDCTKGTGAQVVLDVNSSPDYKGGEIGFFLVTPESHTQKGQCAGGDCCATSARLAKGEGYAYYSQRQFNDDNSGPSSFIHLLIYDSQLSKEKFYFAWEDIYGGSNNTFTDLVTSVQGIECSGGGTPCVTGQKGVCGLGTNRCEAGVLTCNATYQPRLEYCNGLDDDCDGVVDDGAHCPAGEVCSNGACVPHCAQSSEFSCGTEMSCDAATGLCGDPACAGVTCPPDKICRAGQCVGACDGIVCPHGTECRLGQCIEPCKYVQCEAGQVCAGGLCVPACNQCGGLVCSAPLSCDVASGGCKDSSCVTPCAQGTFCDHGACKDACDGAKCPAGQTCQGGACVGPGSPSGGGGDAGDGSGGDEDSTGDDAGCGGCAGARPAGRGQAMFLFALVGAGGLLRRRRR